MPASASIPPLISVPLSVYNGARFLRGQLDSILAQRDVHIEVVAVDDGSTDDSLAILHGYAERDRRLHVHPNPRNLGPTRSFERAMTLCRGEFIAPSDQDDLWHPAKLATLLDAIGEHDLAYCNSAYIDDAGRASGRCISDDLDMLWGRQAIPFLFANSVSGHAMLLRRSLFEAVKPLPAGLYYDWVLAMFAAARHGIVYVDEPLVQFRRHQQAFSSLGKARGPKRPGRDRAWLDDRYLLMRTLAESRFDTDGHGDRLSRAMAQALAGESRLPLLRSIWQLRALVSCTPGAPMRHALRLQVRMMRKLRRARKQAAPAPTTAAP
jgi:glycosyltransferase involved in cell wall biosynthesis